MDTDPASVRPAYLHWSPIVAGAIVTAAVSFVLISFGSGIGLAVASPSSSWRDTSSLLALLGGLWLLLTSLAAFGLGGYLAGHLREILSTAPPDAVEFRDGIHGVLVWGLAILMGALLTLSASRMVAGRADLTAPTAATAEPLLAFELDRLFRSDRSPAELGTDSEIRAQAARIITTSAIGRKGMEQDDRDLSWFVWSRLGLAYTSTSGGRTTRRSSNRSGEGCDHQSSAWDSYFGVHDWLLAPARPGGGVASCGCWRSTSRRRCDSPFLASLGSE